MAKSLFLRSLQSVLFTTPYPIEHKLAFSTEFLKHTQKIFSNDPSVVTAPQNAPPHVPKIEIKSPDQSHVAQFSNDRISFLYQDTLNAKPSLSAAFQHFMSGFQQEIQSTMEFLNPQVVRMGFIVRMIADLGCSTNRFLSEEFLKNNPFPDAHEINLGILYKLQLEGFRINRWVRYRTLRAQNDPSIDYAMAIEIDLNTFAEEMNNFSSSEILQFHTLSFDNVMKDLKNYPLLDLDLESGME